MPREAHRYPLLDLEDEIEKLSSAASLPDADQKRLKDLKAELDDIVKKKEKYLEEHPEQRKLVFRPRRHPRDDQPSKNVAPASGSVEEEGGWPVISVDIAVDRFPCAQRTQTMISSCQKALPRA